MDNNELVKALRDRARPHRPMNIPGSTWTGGMCTDELSLATADAIEQLTAQLMANDVDLKAMRGAANSFKFENAELKQQLATMTAERDVAIKDMHHNDACKVCIGSAVEVLDCDCECLECQLECRCKDCRDENKWQWRGAQGKPLKGELNGTTSD